MFKLAFGIHNHQPVGNFEAVFEEAHTHAYAPFLELIKKFDNVAISLHQSGILWDWQKQVHPEYFKLVTQLIKKQKVELLTGGFYEPILCSIPERDATGQIAMLTEYLADNFKCQPDGLWLTERIWEPHLPKLLAQSGVKYLPVDDTHFIHAGLEPEQLTGPFVTENEGYSVRLLPIDKKMRYLIPFGTVDEIISELKSRADQNPDGMVVYADDGEKFGVWPNTYKHCYEDRWLENFFEAVAENSDWLKIIPLGEAASEEAVGRVYLPTASYSEMLHWALPPTAYLEYENFEKWLKEQEMTERFGRFVRGGHWRGFLAKYEESNLMHKKMLAVSSRLNDYHNGHQSVTNKLETARHKLYAGQCNCPYWHGVFGGLYLPHIRQAVYSNLIEADSILNDLEGLKSVRIKVTDFDCDGHDEVIINSGSYTAVLQPAHGGRLLDLAANKHNFSLTDTLTRRREGYHLKLDQAATEANSGDSASIHDLVLAKEDGLKEFLAEDWYTRRAFLDHFFSDDVTPDKFLTGKFGEEGDFIIEPYDYLIDNKKNGVKLTRDGMLWKPEGKLPLRVSKTFTFTAGSDLFTIDYELSLPAGDQASVNFAVENNFNFQAGHAEDRFVLIDNQLPASPFLDSVGKHDGSFSVAMVDQYRDLAVAVISTEESSIWHVPIFTVSLSEGGFEKVYQGTSLLHCFRLNLSQEITRLSFTLGSGTAGQVRTMLNETAISTHG